MFPGNMRLQFAKSSFTCNRSQKFILRDWPNFD